MAEEDYPDSYDPADELGDQPEHVQALAHKFARMRANNQRIQMRLTQQGATLDVASAQIEFFTAQLILLGVLTQEQYWQMKLDWQVTLRKQLSMVLEKQNELRDRVNAQRNRPTLLVPDHVADTGGKSKIILPGT